MKRCAICGHNLGDDLFSVVTGEKCCSICKINFIGCLPTSDERIAAVREMLNLGDGEYLTLDRPKEARRILGKVSAE